MLSRQNSVLKIEMWLAVQYWEMFYNDNSEDEQNDEGHVSVIVVSFIGSIQRFQQRNDQEVNVRGGQQEGLERIVSVE